MSEGCEWRIRIEDYFERGAELRRSSGLECSSALVQSVAIICECLLRGGKILMCGNGGSAADCQHIAAEFVNVVNPDVGRPPLAALALTTDSSVLTACANDFGFEEVFARQVRALGAPGDVLLALSTSGKSTNVIKALEVAQEGGLQTIGFTGGAGGGMESFVDVLIRVPSYDVQLIQEVHIAMGHIICLLVERHMFGEGVVKTR